MKKILKLFLIMMIGIIGGTLLLLFVNILPNGKMQNHISESVSVMETEGDYPMLINGYISSRLDNFTDSIMLVSTAEKADASLIDRTMNMYRVLYEDKRPSEVLVAYGKGDKNYTIGGYSRYWHGYQLVLKPLLLMFNYQEIRYINMCLQILLIAFVAAIMWKKNLKIYVLPYLIMIFSLTPVSVALSLQFSTIFYLMNIAIIILLIWLNKIEETENILAFFFSVGMATSFFDFLTYPLATFGMPLVIYFMLKKKDTLLSDILKIIQYGIAWTIGYGGMWAGKWIVGSILLRKNIISEALTSISIRTSSEDFSRKDAILQNVSTMFETPVKYIFLTLGFVLLIWLVVKMVKDKRLYLKNYHYLLIAVMPFVWYIVLADHSYVHFWFTYRELSIFIFAVLIWLCKNIEECRETVDKL